MTNKIFNVVYFIFYVAAVIDVILLVGSQYEQGQRADVAAALPVVVFIYGGILIFKKLFRKDGKATSS